MFLKATGSARLSTRRTTHTLDLTRIKPSVLGETVLPEDWLAHIIDNLPGLRSLIIHDLAAFDYRSLRVFNNWSDSVSVLRSNSSLRLFTASLVVNAVSSSMFGAMEAFPALVYLDFSSTTAVNKLDVLEKISSVNTFPFLEILKLRNIGLTDAGLWKLAVGLGTRVWSLDVRRNHLTDTAVSCLLEHCFLPDEHVFSESYHDEQMQYMGAPGPLDDELSVSRRLVKSSSLRQHRTGITHLYISDNDLSLDSAKLLIKSWRLTALDLGKFTLRDHARLIPDKYRDALAANEFRETLHMQMTDGARLRYLRIDHRLITGDAILLDKGIAAFKEGWTFWPSIDWDFMEQGSIAYDKNFPGLGIHTLVLTGLPNTSARGWITKTLVAFLGKCNEMESDLHNDPRAIDSEGHPSSILRELHLEMPEIFDQKVLEAHVEALDYLRAVEFDFSFFREEVPRGDSSSSRGASHRPEASAPTEEDLYKGEIAKQLMVLQTQHPSSWSGEVAVARPLGPQERESLVPSRYTKILTAGLQKSSFHFFHDTGTNLFHLQNTGTRI